MNVYLISEDEALGQSIRQIMIRERIYCPLSSMISFDQALRHLAGLAIDLIVAILPEDPIRSVEALEVLSHLPRSDRTLVIAVGPAADARLVIRALRGVVDDYLDIDELENELVAVLTSWRHRWTLERPEGKLVAVLGPSGGSGASLIAANLAVQAARFMKDVGLIDLKLETGDLGTLLDLKPTHSLADLCKNIDRLDQHFFEQSLAPHPSGVRLLASPKSLADIDLVTPEGIRQAISLARVTFPFVVVDLEHRFDPQQIQILRHADPILLVLRLDFTSLRTMRKFLEHLDGLGIASNRIKLVVNRHGQPKEVPIARLEEALGCKVFQTLPDDPWAVNRANNHGVPVTLDAPKSRIARSLARLTQAVLANANLETQARTKENNGASSMISHAGSKTLRNGFAADYRPNLMASTKTSDRR